ncbi:hypothetical protein ABZY68_21295 [Streptomyces sp. NPDC006482]
MATELLVLLPMRKWPFVSGLALWPSSRTPALYVCPTAPEHPHAELMH